MKKITVEQIMKWRPCSEYPKSQVQKLIGKGKTPIEILDLDIPILDRFWVLFREEIIPERQLQLLACDFLEQVLLIFEKKYHKDGESRKAIEAKRLWLDGKLSDGELKKAQNAAYAGIPKAASYMVYSFYCTVSSIAYKVCSAYDICYVVYDIYFANYIDDAHAAAIKTKQIEIVKCVLLELKNLKEI